MDDFGGATRTRAPGLQSSSEDGDPDRLAHRPTARSYLLVVEGGSSAMHVLPDSGELVIGRGDGADVRLTDTSVSRVHARVSVRGGDARLQDAGSHNGTRVNGEPVVSARSLGSGDVISVGTVTLVFHRDRPHRPARRAMLELLPFRQRLEEEVERSLRYGRPCTLLAVDLTGHEPLDRIQVAAAVASTLRLIDVAAWDEGSRLLVILPETDAAGSDASRTRLLGALVPLAAGARIGSATCPHDGCDSDTLLTGARSAAQVAEPGSAAGAADAASRLTIAEQSVLVADPAMTRIFALLQRLAASSMPVLVYGETGAGKEIAAAAIHHWSPRAAAPLVAINCAALQETLVESELFGYEKGAFSGATSAKPGMLEAASGGTVFLDEVGELSVAIQAKLLRVLETRRMSRLGSVTEREIDVRFVAATNRNLEEEVAAGRFRQDLYFRLSAATVVLPPLRDRPRDIPLLARAFLDEACERAGRAAMEITPAAMQALAQYRWPGNVRELRNLMDYLAAVAPRAELDAVDLPAKLLGGADQRDEHDAATQPLAAPDTGDDDGSAGAPGERQFRPLDEEIRELEQLRMAEALEAAGGNQTRAAQLIRMPLRTFVAKVKTYGLSARTRRRGQGG